MTFSTLMTESAPDIHELVRLHMECSAKRDGLLEECRRLMDEGKVREAQEALNKAEEIEKWLKELEAELKPRGP